MLIFGVPMKTVIKLKIVLFFIIFSKSSSYSQSVLYFQESIDRSVETRVPSTRNIYSNSSNKTGEYEAKASFSIDINSVGLGWSSPNPSLSPSSFHIEYRYKDSNGWTSWNHAHGEIMPNESPSNMYWSSLITTDYMIGVRDIEVKITPPLGELIQSLTIDASYITVNNKKATMIGAGSRSSNCPSQPFILSRSDWWGNLPADELSYPNATNTKTVSYNTNTTHGFIHHGASSNNYIDGASIVRAYWNFHVNSRGWKDIGYNYLVDKFGNLYMGRHNDDWPNKDVLGAHTGVCNPYSFAICAVGDYDTIQFNSVMLNSINHLMAYKCDLRGMNPVGTGFIYNATIDIISGHRVAPGASTTCPGDSAFNILNQIRIGTKAILDSCALIPLPNIDSISPVTTINYFNLWETTDFVVSISDVDDTAGSGVKDQLVNVSYFDNEWKANFSNGYFNDQFDQLSADWISSVGNWYIANNKLKQDDENEANTNLYASLNQNNSNKYLYHWKGIISGSGTNKRAGLHFMCSSPTQTERGDSYMVYLREDNDRIQIYKSVGNTLYLREDTSYAFNAGVEYDIKVLFSKSTGNIDVLIDDQLEASYTDPWPFSAGDFVSFRTGNCVYEVDQLEVFKERDSSVLVTVGPGTKDIPVQNSSPSQSVGSIKSLALDSAGNISSVIEKNINVDWTKPQSQYINDGFTQNIDVDTFFSDDKIEGNWLGNDNHSGIKKYYFGAGDTPGSTNIIAFTDVGLVTQYSGNTSLTYGQDYYVSIRLVNEAGLDTVVTSNGQHLKDSVVVIGIGEVDKRVSNILLYPNPSTGVINLSLNSNQIEKGEIIIIDSKGSEVYNTSLQIKEGRNKFQISPNLVKGYYFVKLNLVDSQILLGVQGVE
jgi:hypothetical protein